MRERRGESDKGEKKVIKERRKKERQRKRRGEREGTR